MSAAILLILHICSFSFVKAFRSGTDCPAMQVFPTSNRTDLDSYFKAYATHKSGIEIISSRADAAEEGTYFNYAFRNTYYTIDTICKGRASPMCYELGRSGLKIILTQDTEKKSSLLPYADTEADYESVFMFPREPLRSFPLIIVQGDTAANIPNSPYYPENIMVHEFAHALHFVAMERIRFASFKQQAERVFSYLDQTELFKGNYLRFSVGEMVAEASQIYFNAIKTIRPAPYNITYPVASRKEMWNYSPVMASLMRVLYGDIDLEPFCNE